MTSDGQAPSERSRLRVASTERPGWRVGVDSPPYVGESVFCVDGLAEVVRLLGRTGDGSRLLELRLAQGSTAAYFAAASNVLRRSPETEDDACADDEATPIRDQLIGGSDRDMIGVTT